MSRVVKATLVKLSTDDGLVSVEPHVPLGRAYDVDLDTVREADMFNVEKMVGHRKVIADCRCIHGASAHWAWMALELLKFEADA